MKAAIKCALLSIVISYPMAMLFALVFRFPVPFAGYIGPFTQHGMATFNLFKLAEAIGIAWVFYCILFGGFVVLAIGGAIAGMISTYLSEKKQADSKPNLLYPSAMVAFLGCLFMATLDYMIGPW